MMLFEQFLYENVGSVNLATDLFYMARNSATIAHKQHLNSKSRSEHEALQEYYDGIITLTDRLMECFIQRFGRMCDSPETIDFLSVEGFAKWLETYRYDITDVPHIQTIIDEMLILCDSVLYKLRYLN